MDLKLSDKHVLITGASQGIGLACARGFLREGARVSLVARNPDRLQSARQQLQASVADAGDRILTCVADLQLPDQAASALAQARTHWGRVDVLVNSAGGAQRAPPADLDAQAWRDAMNAKFFTYVHMIDPVIKVMGESGSGVIVNIVGAGGKVASPIHLPGGAANAALMLISAGLAAAYAPHGVRVNAVNPGATVTGRLRSGMQASARLQQITVEEALERAARAIPMGRFAQPEEIADAVLFLASARASYITGVVLTMDGGCTPMVV